jgi:methylmalonyl-CoA mutase N-terminal domain/subunit
VAEAADPLGGAYFVEALTTRMEEDAGAYVSRIDELGGMVRAVEQGFPQREIAEASFRFQQSLERRERTIVGVNDLVMPDERPIAILRIDPEVERRQVERVGQVRVQRDGAAARRALDALRAATEAGENTMDRIVDAVRARVTVGEICDVFRAVYGEYREPAII